MGSLLQALGQEEDLLSRVLLHLEPADLHSLELCCRDLRVFMAGARTWRRRLQTDFHELSGDEVVQQQEEASPVEVHVRCKQRYAEREGELAARRWGRFCRSWMTMMTISSLYSFLHPAAEVEEEHDCLDIEPLL
jgi:hypothetical protein